MVDRISDCERAGGWYDVKFGEGRPKVSGEHVTACVRAVFECSAVVVRTLSGELIEELPMQRNRRDPRFLGHHLAMRSERLH